MLVFFFFTATAFSPHVEHRLQTDQIWVTVHVPVKLFKWDLAKELEDFNRFKQISTDLITELIRFESRMHTDEHSKLIIYKLFIFIWIFTRKTNTQSQFTREMLHFKVWDIHCKRNYDALRKTITKMFKAYIYYGQIINNFMWIKCKPATKPWCIKS